ncbi:hypothetical protein KEJ37_00140 [Candidatus Bathyarchaeota archaeon]|nr:hypothetical protein [Candidatus Bathyarchaeota archaeon]
MDVNTRLLALAERLERMALDLEAYSALIEKYNRIIREGLKRFRTPIIQTLRGG